MNNAKSTVPKILCLSLQYVISVQKNGVKALIQPRPTVYLSRGSVQLTQIHSNARIETDDLDLTRVESHTAVDRDPVTNEPTRQQMIYVDEYNCIGCTECAMIAGSTFFMEGDNGRARVFRQWGDDDETVKVAIETCPVDCIHYVPYDELKSLEIERRDQIINFKSRLVGGDGPAPQKISGNSKARCPNCPTRACDDCPMYLVGKNQPKYDVIGPVPKVAAVHGAQRRRLERSMKKLISEVSYSNNISSENVTSKELSEELFSIIDRDGDGFLKKSELVAAGMDMSAVNLLDMNRDGQIGREEFLCAVELVKKEEPGEISRVKTSASDPNIATELSSAESSILVEEIEDSLGELQPLERQELRLAGFEPYILISVLTSESSFQTLKEYNIDWTTVDGMTMDMETAISIITGQSELQEYANSNGEFLGNIDWFIVGIQLSSAVSAVCGIYATVVFSLCILYGKTALGVDRDEEYFTFMENTGLQRFRAFKAFSWGLFYWVVTLLLVLCSHAPFVFRLPLLGASAVLLYLGKTEYDVITASAAPMFMPRSRK